MPIDPHIQRIRIHPAIGFARLSTNNDYYVFGEPDVSQATYKSNKKIKRQAVQFKLFAYGANNAGLYELTADRLQQMKLKAVWTINLANRKTAKARVDAAYVITTSGDTSAGDLNLVGRCGDFVEGQAIPLGRLTQGGLFIPPLAGIFKRSANTPIPDSGMYHDSITDNTSDGPVSVRLAPTDNSSVPNVSILPGWVVVCPPDFAPDWNESNDRNLLLYMQRQLNTPNSPLTNPVNRKAQQLDREVLERGTSEFLPGIEIDDSFDRHDLYAATETQDPDEIRFRQKLGGTGIDPGDITDSLCSPWQFDFRACTCHYWPNHRPDLVFKDNGNGAEARWLRKVSSQDGANPPGGMLQTNADVIDHVDELGIVRRNHALPDKRAETERDNDVGGMV